ncbi:MAG: MlaD family protein [Armatimonadota bacterium]
MEISSAAKVGMITLLALIIVGLIFSQIGSWKDRESGYEIGVVFDQIAGLQPQAKVSLSGVTVGKVKKIEILPNGRVEVTLIITYKGLQIEKDAIFTILGSLFGDKWVEIYPRPKEEGLSGPQIPAAPLNPGDIVLGQPPVSVERMLVEGQQTLRQLREAVAQINKLVGDPKMQAEFKGTVSNFYSASKNIDSSISSISNDVKGMVADLRGSVDRITSDLMGFSGSVNRMANHNEDDLKVIVTNIKEMSVNLNSAVAKINEIVTKEEFSEDIAATLSNIKDASENIAGIASDIRIITSDPQIRQDLKETISEAKKTVHQANVMFSNVNDIIGGDGEKKNKLFRLDVEGEWVKATGLSTPNMNLRLFPDGKMNYKIGADNIGHGALYNLQAGTNYKDMIFPRLGIIRSNLGIGFDTRIGKFFEVSVDAYDTQNTKVDAIGRVKVGAGFYLLGGQRNVFDPQLKTSIFGVGKSF